MIIDRGFLGLYNSFKVGLRLNKFKYNFEELQTMPFDTNISVLIVDDYKTMLRIIRNLLKQIGFEDVDEAYDGTDALKKISQKKYGLIISDWNMQPMNGFDFLKSVRSSPESKEIPFIMVTAESKTENVLAAKNAGVDNYIVKPFNAETLRSKVESVLT